MSRFAPLFAAVTAGLLLADAGAQESKSFDGAEFERLCASQRGKDWCHGFLMGVLQTDALAAAAADQPPPWCIPGHINLPAIVALTVELLDRRQEYRRVIAAGVVRTALRENFRCTSPAR